MHVRAFVNVLLLFVVNATRDAVANAKSPGKVCAVSVGVKAPLMQEDSANRRHGINN